MKITQFHRSLACALTALTLFGASTSAVHADEKSYIQRVIQSMTDTAVHGERTQQTAGAVAAVRG